MQNYAMPILTNLRSCCKTPGRSYTLRRATLYVPGDDFKKVLEAFLVGTDCIIFDCEDGVALKNKMQARLNIRGILDKGKPQRSRRYDFAVRVNPPSSGILKNDLDVLLTGKHFPDTICLPKVDTVDDLKMFSELLNKYMKNTATINLIIGIESPLSLVNIVDICRSAQALAAPTKFTPAALSFGNNDFYSIIGTAKSDTKFQFTYAREKIVTVAKAFDLQAIDMVYNRYKDSEGLRQQAQQGAEMGFDGKQVVHPKQVKITQEVFSPTQKEIEWAKSVLKTFHLKQAEGRGTLTYQGINIHPSVLKMAQKILDLAEIISQK